MKEVIKKILKEETDRKNIKKGIDLMVQFAKTEFPYILYAKLRDDVSSFKTEINVYCDVEKLKEFYNSEIKSYYEKDYIENDEGFAYPVSILKISDTMNTDEKYKMFDEINDSLNFHYKSLPEEYVDYDLWDNVKPIYAEKFFFV